MLRNQATALLRHEHLTTTVPRAKELRPFVERIITIAKRGVTGTGESPAGVIKTLNARRLVMQDLQDREVVSKLFDTIAPRFAERAGGYTRLLRLGFRKGDSAEIAQVELVGSEYDPKAKTEAGGEDAPKPKPKSVTGRLRDAASRLRGKKDEGEAGQKKASAKPSKGVARKTTTPRKAGGS
jgi:large subunit ribosomal protein L17